MSLALKIPDGAKHVSGGWDLRSELIAASLERCIYPRAGCSIKDQTMEVSPKDRQEAQFQWSVGRERCAGGFGSFRWDDQRPATHLGTEMRSKRSQGQDGSGDPLMRKMVSGVSCNAKSSTPHAFAGAPCSVTHAQSSLAQGFCLCTCVYTSAMAAPSSLVVCAAGPHGHSVELLFGGAVRNSAIVESLGVWIWPR